MITLLPNNIQKSKKVYCLYLHLFFMAELMPNQAIFIAETILTYKWCIPTKWRPKGCQQQRIWVCFEPVLSPVLVPILSYVVPVKQEIGEEIQPNDWTPHPCPTIPLFVLGACCSADDVSLSLFCQEGLTIPDWVCFTHQRVREGRGEPEALPRLQSRLFQTVLWSPQRAPQLSGHSWWR